MTGDGAKTSDDSLNFLTRFSAIQLLDRSDSTLNQLLSSLSFQPYTDRSLKVAKEFPRFSCNPIFET